jgi:glycosyltransferase involved in cell wall biosynthesis
VISVIIGTENSERTLVPTLATLVSGAAAGVIREVIVADAGSTDATAEVADIAGCDLVVSKAPLAARLKQAAHRARSPWLMFLKPGVVLDASWIEETSRFVEQAEMNGRPDMRVALFRRAPSVIDSRPLLFEALAMLKTALGGRPHPEQGLLIFKRLYEQLGGHRPDVRDPEADLLARLGRKRTIMLRSGAVKVVED